MIKKLRIKLIAAAMISLLIVLSVIVGGVNLLNYRSIVADADEILGVLQENEGRFPASEQPDHAKDEKGADNNSERKDFQRDIDRQRPGTQSPELPYESRFFSVLIGEDGTILATDTGKIAAVDTLTANVYAMDVWAGKKTRGFVDCYRYVRSQEAGNVRIIFLDCRRNLDNCKKLFVISMIVSILGLCMVFVLLFLLSGHIVRPFSENYEKQKRFITDAGHEIKTPLTIINADTEVLEMETGPSEWIDDMRKQIKRMTSLTNGLIYLSKMEEEQNKMEMLDFPISDMVSETASSFEKLAETQGKSLEIYVEPMLSFCGNEASLGQLVSILLDNAVKYSGSDGLIILELRKKGRNICLTVQNTADSITKENLQHLFDRFYRADSSRNSESGGYGIGLSIAKAIVNAHKGKITASSLDGHSLEISVVLPVF